MSVTITCQIFDYDGNAQKIYDYLAKQGITFGKNGANRCLFIELKQLPEVLRNLERSNFHLPNRNDYWQLTDITDQGVTLYIAHPEVGDGWVFISQSNVLAMHTITKEQLIEMADYRMSE